MRVDGHADDARPPAGEDGASFVRRHPQWAWLIRAFGWAHVAWAVLVVVVISLGALFGASAWYWRLTGLGIVLVVAYAAAVVGLALVRFGRTGRFLPPSPVDDQPSLPVVRRLPKIAAWLKWVVYGMAISGYSAVLLHRVPTALVAMQRLHKWIGVGLLLVLMFSMWRLSRTRFRFGRLGSGFMTMLPVSYAVMLLPTGSFPPILLLLFVYVPAFLLLVRLPRVPSARRFDISIGILSATFLSYSGASASIALLGQDLIRFVATYRTIHGLTVLPAVLVFGYWLGLQARLARGLPMPVPGWAAARKPLTLVAASFVAGVVLHVVKFSRSPFGAERHDRYESPARAVERGHRERLFDGSRLGRSATCGECHALTYQQWLGSTHANAVNRAFVVAIRDIEARTGRSLGRDCLICHDPTLALSPDVESAVHDDARLAASEGVSCVACHNMVEATSNTKFVLEFTTASFLPEPLRHDYISTNVMQHSRQMSSDAVRKGRICETCHRNETVQNGHTFLPRDTVTSFEESQDARKMRCYGCHMARTTLDAGGYSWLDHQFLGANTLVDRTSLKTSHEELQAAASRADDIRQWLRGKLALVDREVAANQSRSLDDAFIDMFIEPYNLQNPFRANQELGRVYQVFGSPPLSATIESATCERGQARIKGRVANTNIGHDYPETLFANLERVWVEARLLNDSGQVVADSDPGGALAHGLGRHETLEDGTLISDDQLFEYVRLEGRVIPPGASVDDEFSLGIPAAERSGLRVQYLLNSQRYSDDFSARMAIPGLATAPIIIMAEATAPLNCARSDAGRAARRRVDPERAPR